MSSRVFAPNPWPGGRPVLIAAHGGAAPAPHLNRAQLIPYGAGSFAGTLVLRSIRFEAEASPDFAASNPRHGGRPVLIAAHGDRHACAGCAAQVARPHVLRIHVLRSKGILPGQSHEGTVPIVITHFSHLNNYQFTTDFPIFSI